mgnify:FL=1
MIASQRLERLRHELAGQPRCSIAYLERTLGVSRATVRRDLIALERGGEVVRVHGGVVASGLRQGETTFQRRRSERAPAKLAIPRAAAPRIGEGQCVYVDAGTTCLEVGRLLLRRRDVRLVTHSVPLLAEAATAEAQVVGIGGVLRPGSEALVGDLAHAWLDRLRLDVACLGASGLDPDEGTSTTEPSEAEVKRRVLSRAARAMLCADRHKADAPSTVRFAQWPEFDLWITDAWPAGWPSREGWPTDVCLAA